MMGKLAFVRDRLWDLQVFLGSWINIIENVDFWIVWLTCKPESHLAAFDYWQFWNHLNGNCLDILFEDAKESFKKLYPHLKNDTN